MPTIQEAKDKFNRMKQWLKDAGGYIGNIKVHFQTSNERGVVATEDISKGDILLSVPKSRILTLRKTVLSGIAREMYELRMHKRLISPNYSFIAVYLLERRRNNWKSKQFSEFLDLFPKSVSNFPVLF